MGSLKALRKSGSSAYLSGAPMRWLTEGSVEAEIRYFHEGKSADRRIEVLRSLGIETQDNPDHLSYGQKKLVCLLSLPERLELVALDEPFADLSLKHIGVVEDFLEEQVTSSNWRAVIMSFSSDVVKEGENDTD
jgi:energy-coupling factor transporter ATP-binding protein EcfA2